MKIKLNNDMELILDNENSDGICHVSLIDSSDGAVINTCDIGDDALFEFISSQWQYEKDIMENTNAEKKPDKIENEVKPNLKPYLVHVTEMYSRNAVIYAEDSYSAKHLANDLCEEGILLIDFDNFNDRSIETIREAKESDLPIYESFDSSKLFERVNIPLENRIRYAKENTANQPLKNTKEKERML